MKNLILLSLFFLCNLETAQAEDAPPTQYTTCLQDKVRLESRSHELTLIVKADQDERKNWQNKSPEEWNDTAKSDLIRRKRVGEIFGEGCFSKAEDYAAAALVYQHGDSPDHFFQTFLWSKRAVDLGDANQKEMMALGIDRYLVSIGQKQLFGSQAFKPDFNPDTCYCLHQIESTFPEKTRLEYTGKALHHYFHWLNDVNKGKTCPKTECSAELKGTPRGSVPGFW